MFFTSSIEKTKKKQNYKRNNTKSTSFLNNLVHFENVLISFSVDSFLLSNFRQQFFRNGITLII